jgi:hypothetical protein
MPYTIRKVRNKSCYTVTKKYNKSSKQKTKPRVFSKCTTRKNAEKQVRLLRAIEYGKGRFIPNAVRNRTMKKL